jgi:hypothetical protein
MNMRAFVVAGVFLLVSGLQQSVTPAGSGPQEQAQTQRDQAQQEHAQQGRGLFSRAAAVPKAEVDAILSRSAAKYPKFYALYTHAMAKDKLITSIRWMRAPVANSPGAARPDGVIVLDPQFLEPGVAGFDDNRLVVVIEHEIGHLHYFQTVPRAEWTSDRSEQAAFEYSLSTTKAMAEKGDCGPLKTGVVFMKLRSEGMNSQDPHVRALKRMVTEPLYAGYVEYVAKTPACQAVTVKVPERMAGRPR